MKVNVVEDAGETESGANDTTGITKEGAIRVGRKGEEGEMVGRGRESGSKQTMSTNSGLWLLQIISEPSFERCATEDVSPLRGGLLGPTSVVEENKHSLQGV